VNQLYLQAEPIVTQMVVQAGLLGIYLQLIDFSELYQQKWNQGMNREDAVVEKNRLDSSKKDFHGFFKSIEIELKSSIIN
jgi:hypothetical protein